MYRKRFFTILCLLLTLIGATAQLRYPIVGEYNEAAAQGMAIYGDHAFLMNDKGCVRVYNLKEKRLEREFLLGSAADDNHANTACFGCEIAEGGTMPVLYVTQCNDPFYCYVENVLNDTSMVVQTIRVVLDEKPLSVCAWVVDIDDQSLYSITHMTKDLDSLASRENVIRKYCLPKLSEGKEVIFTEKDVIDTFSVVFPNLPQGTKIKDHILYFVTGQGQKWSSLKDAHRSLKVISLSERCLIDDIDLTYLTTNEPEDIDFYKGMFLLYCGGEGGLWEITLR